MESDTMSRPGSYHEIDMVSKLKKPPKRSEMTSKYQNSQNASSPARSNSKPQPVLVQKAMTPYRVSNISGSNAPADLKMKKSSTEGIIAKSEKPNI
jgi:hypothetical protein